MSEVAAEHAIFEAATSLAIFDRHHTYVFDSIIKSPNGNWLVSAKDRNTRAIRRVAVDVKTGHALKTY